MRPEHTDAAAMAVVATSAQEEIASLRAQVAEGEGKLNDLRSRILARERAQHEAQERADAAAARIKNMEREMDEERLATERDGQRVDEASNTSSNAAADASQSRSRPAKRSRKEMQERAQPQPQPGGSLAPLPNVAEGSGANRSETAADLAAANAPGQELPPPSATASQTQMEVSQTEEASATEAKRADAKGTEAADEGAAGVNGGSGMAEGDVAAAPAKQSAPKPRGGARARAASKTPPARAASKTPPARTSAVKTPPASGGSFKDAESVMEEEALVDAAVSEGVCVPNMEEARRAIQDDELRTPSSFLVPFRMAELDALKGRRAAVRGQEGQSQLGVLISRTRSRDEGYDGIVMWKARPHPHLILALALALALMLALAKSLSHTHMPRHSTQEDWRRRGAYEVELLFLGYQEGGANEGGTAHQLLDAMIRRLEVPRRPPQQILAKLPEKVAGELWNEWKLLGFQGIPGMGGVHREYP